MAKRFYIPVHKQLAEHEGAIALEESVHGINSFKSLLCKSETRNGRHSRRRKRIPMLISTRFSIFRKLLPPTAWQRAALAFAIAAFLMFTLNLSFILWATASRRHTLEGGIGTISEQGCSHTKQLNTVIHLAINIMSTILLAGSNYCMQCVVAPSRSEVDVAHAKEKWFDIGVQSTRNLWNVGWRKRLIWVLLALSSIPLHLLYNSAVFASTSMNSYNVFLVHQKYINTTNEAASPSMNRTLVDKELMYNASQAGRVDRLSVAQCLDLYGDPFQSSRGSLVVVVGKPEESLSDNDIQFHKEARVFTRSSPEIYIPQPFDWMCRWEVVNDIKTCEDWLREFKATPDNWKPFGQSGVNECYSQATDEHCKLKFSQLLCWVVVAVNLLKVALMLLVAFGRGESPLLTVGDAVASFLEHSDETTRGMCLKTKQDFYIGDWAERSREFDPKRPRKYDAASFTHWVMYHFLHLIPIIVSSFLLGRGLSMMTGNRDIIDLGLGAVNTKTIMIATAQGAGNLVVNALIVNTPQAIMSFIYLNFNALYTNISLVTEWDRFSHRRRGLRVSSPPQGAQRNTYFLQLPYRYSLPMITLSAAIHWLISQSIFLVNLEIYGPPDNDLRNFIPAEYLSHADWMESGASFTACGWSPSGIVAGTVANLCMIAFILASGGRRLRFGSAPVAGSCSAAISAACHPCDAEEDAWEEPLQWGVVAAPADGPGRCSFSSASVGVPSKGQLYA